MGSVSDCCGRERLKNEKGLILGGGDECVERGTYSLEHRREKKGDCGDFLILLIRAEWAI
jgi:hypothetical protein